MSTFIRKKKIASRAYGCTRRTGRFRRSLLNSDADCHSTVHPDADCQGTMRPDADRHGICLPDGAWQGIFLLDAAVSGHFPSGRSRVRAFSFWMQPCQGIFLLDAAVLGHFPTTGRIRTTHVMAPRLRWLSRHGTSQQILRSHSQTRSGFQA